MGLTACDSPDWAYTEGMTELAPRRWAWISSIGLHVAFLLLLALWVQMQPKPHLTLPEPIHISLIDAPTLRRDSGAPGPAPKPQLAKGPAPAAPRTETRQPAAPMAQREASEAPARQAAPTTTNRKPVFKPAAPIDPRPAGDWRTAVSKRQADLQVRERSRLASLGTGSGDGVMSGSGGGDAGEAGGELSGRSLVHEVRPNYPADALRDRVSGRVLVAITVGSDGSVKRASIAASSGDARLDAAARTAIGQWRFAPLPEDLPAADARGTVPVTFWFRAR
jgi:protein TonB